MFVGCLPATIVWALWEVQHSGWHYIPQPFCGFAFITFLTGRRQRWSLGSSMSSKGYVRQCVCGVGGWVNVWVCGLYYHAWLDQLPVHLLCVCVCLPTCTMPVHGMPSILQVTHSNIWWIKTSLASKFCKIIIPFVTNAPHWVHCMIPCL